MKLSWTIYLSTTQHWSELVKFALMAWFISREALFFYEGGASNTMGNLLSSSPAARQGSVSPPPQLRFTQCSPGAVAEAEFAQHRAQHFSRSCDGTKAKGKAANLRYSKLVDKVEMKARRHPQTCLCVRASVDHVPH